MLLEVLLGGGGELHGNELEATVLEAGDDGTNEATLEWGGLAIDQFDSCPRSGAQNPYLDTIGLDGNETVEICQRLDHIARQHAKPSAGGKVWGQISIGVGSKSRTSARQPF